MAELTVPPWPSQCRASTVTVSQLGLGHKQDTNEEKRLSAQITEPRRSSRLLCLCLEPWIFPSTEDCGPNPDICASHFDLHRTQADCCRLMGSSSTTPIQGCLTEPAALMLLKHVCMCECVQDKTKMRAPCKQAQVCRSVVERVSVACLRLSYKHHLKPATPASTQTLLHAQLAVHPVNSPLTQSPQTCPCSAQGPEAAPTAP